MDEANSFYALREDKMSEFGLFFRLPSSLEQRFVPEVVQTRLHHPWSSGSALLVRTGGSCCIGSARGPERVLCMLISRA